jgi:hypothetical protein
MPPLSQQLAELSNQAKKAEDRVAKAQSETRERVEESREKAHREAQAALGRVNDSVSRASEGAKTRFAQLKSKVDTDFQQIEANASERKTKFESWQADNYASDKLADAEAAINYAIASVKLAEVATLDAIDAQVRADVKADQVQPIQA